MELKGWIMEIEWIAMEWNGKVMEMKGWIVYGEESMDLELKGWILN